MFRFVFFLWDPACNVRSSTKRRGGEPTSGSDYYICSRTPGPPKNGASLREVSADTRRERETTTSRSAEEVYPPLITIIEMIEGVSGNSREHVWPCNGVIEVFFFLFLLLQIERTTDTSRPKERGDGPVKKKKKKIRGGTIGIGKIILERKGKCNTYGHSHILTPLLGKSVAQQVDLKRGPIVPTIRWDQSSAISFSLLSFARQHFGE